MRKPFFCIAAIMAAIVLFTSNSFAQTFNPRDLSGVWLISGQRNLSATPPPRTPFGEEKYAQTRPGYGPKGVPPALGNDPTGSCNPLGLVRMLLYNRPMELFTMPDGRVMQFFEWTHALRTIRTDGRPLPADPPELRWYGYSVGRWEGDTFVVETTGLDDRAWVDQFGQVFSDTARVEERYRRTAMETLELTITLDDPQTYTRPWISDKKTFRLQPGYEMREDFCVPLDNESFNQGVRNPAGGVINK
jgi:hypothetical protein